MCPARCAGHIFCGGGEFMLDCLAVGLGGFAGSVLRYLAGKLPLQSPEGFPYVTLMINVLGSFAIGLIAAAAAKHADIDPRLVLFLRVGLCGGFTTFSTFSSETFSLLRAGSYVGAAAYVLLSVLLGVLAVFLAHALVKA